MQNNQARQTANQASTEYLRDNYDIFELDNAEYLLDNPVNEVLYGNPRNELYARIHGVKPYDLIVYGPHANDLAGSRGVPAYEFVEPADRDDVILSANAAQEIDERTAGIREQIARPDAAGSESDTDNEFNGSHYLLNDPIHGEYEQMLKRHVLRHWTAELMRLIDEMTHTVDDHPENLARQIRHARRCIIWGNAGRRIHNPRRCVPDFPDGPRPHWATDA